MKNLKLVLLAIVIVIFFTRCEKESYIEDSIIVVDTISNVDTTPVVPVTPVVKIPNPLGSLKSSNLKVTDGGGVTDIDGNVYNTVTINNQEWMVENLRVTHYSNGEPITMSLEYILYDIGIAYSVLYSTRELTNPLIEGDNGEFVFYAVDTIIAPINDNIWWNYDFPAACYYNNDETFKYNGILYNWYAVSNGIAPDGWHVATRDDWDNLYKYCKNNDITFSSSIKEYSGLDRWGAFGYNENYYHWWTGDGVNATIDSGGEISTFGSNSPRIGFSVICVKNK